MNKTFQYFRSSINNQQKIHAGNESLHNSHPPLFTVKQYPAENKTKVWPHGVVFTQTSSLLI